LPSVRNLSQEHGVSISTVQQAYQVLENLQLITPQPRSGYFVAPRKANRRCLPYRARFSAR
jgi:DNA-binding transcriptional regulator YhcF (GntR family)